jgi:GT2 family glycosyltransferase
MPESGAGRPLTVRHLDLTGDLAQAPPPGQDEFVVLWHGDWPVGQAFADDLAGARQFGTGCVAPDILARAAAGVALEASGRPPDGRTTTVVICTRDRAEDLARCLASLPLQTRAPDQVVVVDNASRDGGRTREVAMAAGVSYVREDRPGLDIARNRGVLASTGDIVAFTDDDVRLHPRWLERLVAAFDEPAIMAVTGLVLPAELETPAQRHFETHWGFGRGYRPIDFGADFFRADRTHGCPAWRIGAGASMAFRREIFDRAGLFDERLDVGAAGCSGDSEYWHRVLAHGGVCRYEPASVAFHYHRRDFAGLSRQIHAYMRGHAAALLVQYERSGNLGNLRRVLLTLPAWYARRCVRRVLRGAGDGDLLLMAEIRGFVSGVLFYLRTPRPDRLASRR